MILDLYFCLWNEAPLLPFFLAHYGPACRRIVALDDGSDDGTLEILAAHPKVEIRHMPEERDSWVIASTRWWNQVWQESRDADWVAIVVTDETATHSAATCSSGSSAFSTLGLTSPIISSIERIAAVCGVLL